MIRPGQPHNPPAGRTRAEFLSHFTDQTGTKYRDHPTPPPEFLMSPLEHFATRCASEPSFLAYALAAYQRRHGLTDELLADVLDCTPDILTRLRLCGMPRASCFADDCRQIAERFGVKVEALEEMCCRGEAAGRSETDAGLHPTADWSC